MVGNPSELELVAVEAIDNATGTLNLETREAIAPSAGCSIIYELEEGEEPTYDGLIKVVYKGIGESNDLSITMMDIARAKIPYELVDCGICAVGCGLIDENGTLLLKRNATYELILGTEDSSAGFDEDGYLLHVKDEEIEFEPMMGIM